MVDIKPIKHELLRTYVPALKSHSTSTRVTRSSTHLYNIHNDDNKYPHLLHTYIRMYAHRLQLYLSTYVVEYIHIIMYMHIYAYMRMYTLITASHVQTLIHLVTDKRMN